MLVESKPVAKENPINPATGNEIHLLREPFVRVSLDGEGCGLKHCNCSPPNYISISDGKTITTVTLIDEEAQAIKSGWASIETD